MVSPHVFFDAAREAGLDFFTGVPDSLLKDFCAFVTDNTSARDHVIAANEGGAVALAAGHYLATGRPALVYMQNSGQGNAVNPLTSLADPDVFGIPMLLLVGWRGEPGGKHDEPQHVKQGKVTFDLFRALGIDAELLPEEDDGAVAVLRRCVERLRAGNCPVAIVVRTGTFAPYKLQTQSPAPFELTREDAVKIVLDAIAGHVVVATTGMTSREMFEYRNQVGSTHQRDFRTVGCMGHASQIALGIALAQPHQQVVCLDGDGAVIMHMGALAIVGSQRPVNFKHVVFNNGAHDSVGGQPTAGLAIDLPAIAAACGYRHVGRADSAASASSQMAQLRDAQGPALLEIRVKKGARANLGRPTSSPAENKRELMSFLGG